MVEAVTVFASVSAETPSGQLYFFILSYLAEGRLDATVTHVSAAQYTEVFLLKVKMYMSSRSLDSF